MVQNQQRHQFHWILQESTAYTYFCKSKIGYKFRKCKTHAETSANYYANWNKAKRSTDKKDQLKNN